MYKAYLQNVKFLSIFHEEPNLARNSELSADLQNLRKTPIEHFFSTYRSLGIDTQELIYNSKFALMVARRQEIWLFDGIIGIKYIANFNAFK